MKIDDAFVERVASRVMEALSHPAIELEASGRHVHLSARDLGILFGKGHRLTRKSDLSQPGQFACVERVTVCGPKNELRNVAVLGPCRPESQVEISATDAKTLGIDPIVRMSGDIAGTPGAKLIGPRGEVVLEQGVIVAKRHIHMTPKDANRLGLQNGRAVAVRLDGKRSVTFNEVIVRVSPDFATYMHIDYDEANACGFKPGMTGLIYPE